MFSGEFKSRRGVNLGGASSKTDKSALLRQAQLERAARERDKKHAKSATRIQAFVRGRSDVFEAKRCLRQELDGLLVLNGGISGDGLGALVDSGQAGVQEDGSIVATQRALRIILFVFSFKQYGDVERLVRVVDSLRDPYPLSTIIPLLPKLFVLCFNVAASAPEVAQHLLDFVSNTIKRLGPNTSRIANDCVNQSAFQLLARYIESMPIGPPYSSPVALVIISQLLEHIPPFASILEQLSSVFAIPNLVDRFSPATVSVSLNAIGLESWISFLASRIDGNRDTHASGLPCLDSHYARANLLANLASFSYAGVIRGTSEESKLDFIKLLRLLIESMPLGFFARLRETNLEDFSSNDDSDSDDDNDEENQMSSIQPPAHSSTLQNLSMESLDISSKLKLSRLVEPAFVNSVVASCANENAQGNEAALLLVAVMYHWPTRKSSILNALTFHAQSKTIAYLSTRLRASVIWQCANEKNGWAMRVNDPGLERVWVALVIVAEALSHQLHIMSDSEFLSLSEPISIGDIITLSSILRNVLFSAYGSASEFPRAVSLSKYNHPILHTLTSLLEQIYSRDSRRSFCPENHWIMITDVEMESFIQLAIADTSDPSYEVGSPIRPSSSSANPIRRLSFSSPRQKILTHIPFVIPFEVRVKIFRAWINQDRTASGLADTWLRPLRRIQVHRTRVFEDAFTQLDPLRDGLKNRIAVTFVSADGLVEAGIDGGGVFKEFLSELLKEVFMEGVFELFQTTEGTHLIYPASNWVFDKQRLRYMEFFGRVIGKALYEGILIDASFAGFFLSKWLGKLSFLDDLQSLDRELYDGLMFLKNYKGDVAELSVNFTATEDLTVEKGGMRTVELVPGGSNLTVTAENRIQYIYLMANYKLNSRISAPCRAFFTGLNEIINTKWLKIFNQSELQILLGGASVPINLDDLRANITYGGDFHELHPTIRIFWEVVEQDMDEEDRRLLVKFVTSCARPPLLGFSELKPGFCVRPSGESEDRLPSASTCVNMLKLPEYRTKEVLKSKLLYAIKSGAGFDLS
ncbi:hypothetical protein HDU80_005826 [Chytriomyces hyalinus]|nr:hypothetical protein HDU80_005826 [Chytriomyces hyalinus]